MGVFLNSRVPYDLYRATAAEKYFVDKSELLAELIPALGRNQRFFCITRPRRFGKSVMANMVGAFFGKTEDTGGLFRRLKIASPEISERLKKNGCKDYEEYLNHYDIIYIDFSQIPENCASYQTYIGRILSGLKKDLAEGLSDCGPDAEASVWDMLTMVYQRTGRRFIFILDEWDAVFHMEFISDADRRAYLLFLKALLKDKIYAELVYMTGILPIAKYSDGSELNMFVEYNMATSERFSGYFGFSDPEVDRLYSIYRETVEEAKITRDDLRTWYDGYRTALGEQVYNPRSIVCALTDNQLRNYWTSSGSYDSIFAYIRDNVADIRDDLALLFAGERIQADICEYAATSMRLETKDEIYSAMVVYGLLTYEGGAVAIPNKELADSFASMMKKEKSLGYSNEAELSAVVNLVYLAARDSYRVEREDKAGEGYVDFIFYPERKSADAIILELKVDSTPEEAVRQIRDKRYALRFKGKIGEKQRYTGRILGVGISYDKKSKEHFCIIEEL